MAQSTPTALTVLVFFLHVVGTCTQSTSGACGTNINSSHPWYQIRFISYCNTRLLGSTFPATPQATFQDCSATCVQAGITCGGFTYDRDSHISTNNCYLLEATADAYQTGSTSENIYFDSAKVDNGSIPITRQDCESVGVNGVYRGYNLRCNEAIFDNSGDSAAQLDTVFASSITDCVDHCYDAQSDTGAALCQAVTWDPSMVYGYQNCILKGPNYVEPVPIGVWDSATLVDTVGRLLPNQSTNGAGTSTGTSTSMSTSTSTSARTSMSSSSTSSDSSSSSGTSSNTGTQTSPAASSTPSSSSTNDGPIDTGNPPHHSKLSAGQVGAIAGSISGVAVLAALAIVFCVRRNVNRSVDAHNASSMRMIGNPAGFFSAVHEIFSPKEDKGKAREIDGKEVRVSELDARTFSELESPAVPGPSIVRYA